MSKTFHRFLVGVSVLPVFLVMPGFADERIVISGDRNASFATGFSLTGVSTSANGGGVSIENLSTLTFEGTSSFTNNSSTNAGGLGGAIFINNNNGGAGPNDNQVNFNGAATFTGNNANGGGAGLYSEGIVVFDDTATFSDNTTTGGSGAAIGANDLSDITFNGAATFTGNGVGTTTTGGAISNSGNMVFNDTATFDGNHATTNGAAINNGGTMIFRNGLSLTNNVGGSNSGAVSNGGDFFAYGGDIIVTGNTANKGSGLFLGLGSRTFLGVDENGVASPVENITFSNNTANDVNAAALAVQDGVDTVEMRATNITFDGNVSATKYGGAIFNASELKILGTNNTFSNNELHDSTGGKTGGGAIHNRGVLQNGKIADLTIGTETSTNLFENNTSESFGGAIAARAVDGAGQDSSVTINGATTFNSNHADMNGGAIWNQVAQKDGTTGEALVTVNGASTFTSNTAGDFGGAIFNNGETVFNGATTFGGVDNTDPLNPLPLGNNATEGGAIYNTSNLTFNNTASFINNSASDFGGAVKNFGGELTFNGVATFNGNSVTGTGQGGALHNLSATTTFNNGVTFTGNTAATNGAAIYNALNYLYAGVVNINGDALFDGNSTTTPGGGIVFNIYNADVDNTIAFANGDAIFSNNTGVALWNQDVVTFTNMDDVVFDSNTNTSTTAKTVAAISNGGNMTIETNNFIVTNNNGKHGAVGNMSPSSVFTVNATNNILFQNNAGGAIYKENDNLSLTATNDILFVDNTGANGATAINNNGNYSKTTLNADTVHFINNVASAGYAGAIFNSGDYVKIFGNEIYFTGNQANGTGAESVKFGGGAIQNRANAAATNSTSIIEIGTTGSTIAFSNNTSISNGGAIHARAESAGTTGQITLNGSSSFTSNVAALNGGAVSNSPVDGSSILTLNGATTFTDNQAGGLGGAIYNTGVTTINGSGAFSGNKSNYVDSTSFTLNDIYNTNTVNLNANSGQNISFASGIDGINGTLNINAADGYTGAVVFNANVSGNNVNIVRGTLINNAVLDGVLAINGGTVENQNGNSEITGSVTIADGASLSTNADKFATDNAATVSNAGTLTLKGGVSSNPIELSKDVTGDGSLVVDGIVSNNGGEIYNAVTINNNKSFTTDADLLKNTVENSGSNGKLTLTGGTLEHNVTGGGKLYIAGDVVNTANISNTVTINSGKSLTTAAGLLGNTVANSGSLTLTSGTLGKSVTGNGIIYVTGNVSSNANFLGNNVNNSGTLTLTSGTLSKDVSGNGGLVINGAITNNGGNIGNAVTINSGKSLTTSASLLGNNVSNSGTLTLTAGSLTHDVSGSGTVNVSGVVSNSGNLNNLVNIQSSGELTTLADKLKKTVTNNGDLILTGNALSQNVNGTGDLFITGAVSNTGTIANAVTIRDTGSFTTNAGKLQNTVANAGILTLNGGTLAHAVSGQGDVNVTGNVVNNSTIAAHSIDIQNGGTLTSNANRLSGALNNDGTLILTGNGALSQDITGNGTLNIAEGGTLDVGLRNIEQGTINLNGTMVAELDDSVAGPRFTATNFNGAGTLRLTMREAGTYNIFGDDMFDTRLIEFDPAGIDVNSPVYNLVWGTDGTITAQQKTAEEISLDNHVSEDAGLMVSNLMNSTDAKLNDLALVAQNSLANDDKVAVERASLALAPESMPIVQAVGTTMQNTLSTLTANRLSMPLKRDNYGDLHRDAMWVQGLYNRTKQNDGFDGYTRGIAVGFDGMVKNTWTFGAGYVYAQSDIVGTERDIDIDSLAVMLYGQYKAAAWYVNAFIDYNMSNYTENGFVFNAPVNAEYKVNGFGGQISTGYNFNGGFAPELGLRYTHLSVDEYKNSLGVSVITDDKNFVTASLGARYGYGFEVRKNLILRPELSYAVKYDVVADDMSAAIMIPGVDSYSVYNDGLSRVATELNAGLGVRYRGVDVSVGYEIEAREAYTSQTGRARFRIEF